MPTKDSVISFLKRHKFAFLCALVVGVLYVAPNILFVISLVEDYQGIPMMETPNEDFYLARVQEILDGHPSVGSAAYWEYKDEPPISPPTGEFLYALPTLIFGISPSTTLVGSRFVLPALLFLLVYFLARRLTGDDDSMAGRITALASALFVTLGYDLIDYRSILHFLAGDAPLSNGFLIWARPVNPILGAIFLFSFLLCVHSIVAKKERVVRSMLGASVCMALMIASYFFSWGVALSVLAVLILFLLIRKEFCSARLLALSVPLGLLLSFPYWLSVWGATKSPWYASSVLRDGLFYTHYPLLNKLLIATLFFSLLCIVVDYLRKRKKGEPFQFEYWHLFCFSFLLGGLWAYSQQILTGRTIWPYHFVQYTIPLAGITVFTVLFHLRKNLWYLWHIGIAIGIFLSVIYGVYVQASTFSRFYSYDKERQSVAPFLEWLNQREPDCVVLVVEEPLRLGLEGLIPAFTHCNTYHSPWVFSLMPDDRILHSYITRLYFRGISPESVGEYLKKADEAHGYLFSNWKGLYRLPQFPDFSDPIALERVQKLPQAYREFVSEDMSKILRKYRLNYVASVGALEPKILNALPGTTLITVIGDVHLYAFR
ncbi:MAG TPA: hypothetical protein DEF00_02145 [Candidatus Taylorbacteria bacterium]|nr:MAG: hypothetical protein UY03_C0006G0010 [Parcubacteria group bacterium GW2011_GWA2_47_64]KKU96518.1 MAG: hypothetical protein UY29_C0010G0023 [Parcubacteria group bacterium GW2011_GWC2_48_17]HBV01177.1 hypothetical protein [Candidatus Taylorbacteria bacterium]